MDQPSLPPSKRKRVEDSDHLPDAKSATITRSLTLWFEDGNVVVQVEATQFRLHRSILSLHSDILADCFGLPQPEGEPTVDGCPLVYLADAASDVQTVFSIMYGNYSVYDHSKPLPFSAVQAMIRLGRKYNFIAFQEEALRRLHKEFPQTRGDWNSKRMLSFTFLEDTPGLLFDVINFAFENSIQSVLPTAMTWLCTKYPVTQLTSGVQLSDSKKVSLLPGALQLCLTGRYGLCGVISGYVESIVSEYEDFIDDCQRPDGCNNGFRMFLSDILSNNPVNQGTIIASQWNNSVDDDTVESMCTSCGRRLIAQYEVQRCASWNKLPAFFGFPSWASLKDL